jgi:hypothetical protein
MLREFVDPKGVRWKVWDVWPTERLSSATLTSISTFPSLKLSDGWLCFESATEKRRLSPIPPEWEMCDEAALCGFCDCAGFITPTPRDGPSLPDAPRDPA